MNDASARWSGKEPIVKPIVFSHGTLECRDLVQSRRFYEEFLGLETVRHVEIPAILTRLPNSCTVVCVQVGDDRVREQRYFNHWGIDVDTRAEVDAAHEKAVELTDVYGLQKIQEPQMNHGNYSFYFMDRDGNWWEIQSVDEGNSYDDMFAHGDRVEM